MDYYKTSCEVGQSSQQFEARVVVTVSPNYELVCTIAIEQSGSQYYHQLVIIQCHLGTIICH